MDHIKNAVRLAKATPRREAEKPAPSRPQTDPHQGGMHGHGSGYSPPVAATWNPPRVGLDPRHLKDNRIVSASTQGPDHVAFNVLRTRVYQVMIKERWRSLAVTSPKANCGKTTVAVNLAFSLARQTGCRTVLIDLDLRKSSVAGVLGIEPAASIGEFLEGRQRLQDSFVAIHDDLFFGLNDHRHCEGFELAQHHRVAEIIPAVMQGLAPQIVIVDLPPMLASDDAIAFQPFVDASILVAAAGETTAKDIEECEAQFKEEDVFLGVVLNKCNERVDEYYQYQPG